MHIPTKKVKVEFGYNIMPDFKQIIAIGECSSGNESIGNMWLETKVFDKTTTLEEVINWAYKKDIGGKLILTVVDEE